MTSSKARYIATAVLLAAVAFVLCACGARADQEQPPTVAPTTVTASPQPSASTAPAPATVAPEPVPEPTPAYTQAEAEMLARLIWAEARGVPSDAEKAAVAWCVLNRVDSTRWPDTIEGVVTDPYQFAYYSSDPVTEELLALAEDVLTRWGQEKDGLEDVGRVLPADYFFFSGDGKQNHFRMEYESTSTRWGWSLPDPYTGGTP